MSRQAQFKFRLYVAGDAPNSVQAIGNLSAICLAHLPGRYDIEVVDVFRDPKRAMLDAVFLTPTLIQLSPQPLRRIVGTLSDTKMVIQALGLEPTTA